MVHPGRGAKVTTKLAAFRRVGVMVVRELALTALLLLGVSLVVFVILHLSPGDPFSVLLEGRRRARPPAPPCARPSACPPPGTPGTWRGSATWPTATSARRSAPACPWPARSCGRDRTRSISPSAPCSSPCS